MSTPHVTVFVGFDPREAEAYQACVNSLRYHGADDIVPLVRQDLVDQGLFTRSDSGATEFSFTRFLVPHLLNYKGWGMFVDCDFVFTRPMSELFSYADPRYAAMCVQHPPYVSKVAVKMDGQKQTANARKNWSSLFLVNAAHVYVSSLLTPAAVNASSPAWLHQFNWAGDALGELPATWNWLEGEYEVPPMPPAGIHWTLGGPWFAHKQDVAFASEYHKYLNMSL